MSRFCLQHCMSSDNSWLGDCYLYSLRYHAFIVWFFLNIYMDIIALNVPYQPNLLLFVYYYLFDSFGERLMSKLRFKTEFPWLICAPVRLHWNFVVCSHS